MQRAKTNNTLRPDAEQRMRRYRMEISQRSKMGAVTSENTITQRVKKELLTDGENEQVYSVEISDREQSSNKPLHQMEAMIADFHDRLVLRTDRRGAIERVINMLELRQHWKYDRKEFYNRFKDKEGIKSIIKESDALVMTEGAFENALRQSELGSLLFPPHIFEYPYKG